MQTERPLWWISMSDVTLAKTRVVLRQGDITREAVDAIVNAANSGLRGGGGVDGAIHRAGGSEIMTACDAIRAEQGGCPTGSAVITTAGRLNAKYVIHAVGPIWSQNQAEECDRLLASAYRSVLQFATEQEVTSLTGQLAIKKTTNEGMTCHAPTGIITSIAFPSISTGVYGFPIQRAAPLVLQTVREFIERERHTLAEVRFVLFSADDFAVYTAALEGFTGS